MYQLLFRTTNLLLLPYPVLFIESMTYSLTIHFISYRALNDAPHRRHVTEF